MTCLSEKQLADFFTLFADFFQNFSWIAGLTDVFYLSDSVLVNTIVKNEPEDLTGRHRHNSDQAGAGT